MSQLLLSNVEIRQDTENRYCLNDLHKVSGGAYIHRPSYYMRLQDTKALIVEIINSADSHSFVVPYPV